MAETTRQRIEDLIGKGLTVRQIADLLRISTQAVYKQLKLLGITPPVGRTAGLMTWLIASLPLIAAFTGLHIHRTYRKAHPK